MTKPKPKPDIITDERRIEALSQGRALLSDGRWVRLRPRYLGEKFALADILKREGDEVEPTALWRMLVAIVEPAVLETSWGGSVLETSDLQMGEIFAQWPEITDAAAMDPTSASD